MMGDMRGEALLYNALARISIAKKDWDKAIQNSNNLANEARVATGW